MVRPVMVALAGAACLGQVLVVTLLHSTLTSRRLATPPCTVVAPLHNRRGGSQKKPRRATRATEGRPVGMRAESFAGALACT